MSDHDSDLEKPALSQVNETLAKRVKASQERAGFVSDSSNNKAFMGEGYSEDRSNTKGWDVEVLHAAITISLASGALIPANKIQDKTH